MTFNSLRQIFLVALSAIAAMPACKPTADNSELTAIVGTDENGTKVALALLPVSRPVNVNPDTAFKKFGIKGMDKIVRQPAFAFIECKSGKHWSGKNFDEEQWIDGLEALALQNRLFLNTSGEVKVFQKDDWQGVPCKVRGERLVTFPIIEMMQERLAALPQKLLKSDGDFSLFESHVLMAQYLYLALRGSYNPKSNNDQRSTALLSMMMSVGEIHYDKRLTGSDVVKNTWRNYDGVFIPCYKGEDKSNLPKWAREVAKSSFSCRSIKSKPGWYNFLPGGKHTYVSIRSKILEAITVEHIGLNGRTIKKANNKGDRLVQLWDLVTRGYAVKKANYATNMVNYLVANDASLKKTSKSKATGGFSLQEGGPTTSEPAAQPAAQPAPQATAQTAGPAAPVYGPQQASAPPQQPETYQPNKYSGSATPGFDVQTYPQNLQVTPNVSSMYGQMQNYNPGPSPNYIERSEPAPSSLDPVRQQPSATGESSRYAQGPAQFNWDRQKTDTEPADYLNPRAPTEQLGAFSEAQQKTAQGFATGQSQYFPLPDENKDAKLYQQTVQANYTRSMDMVAGLNNPKTINDEQVQDLGGYYENRTGKPLSSNPATARREVQGVFGQDAWANEQAAYPELANLPPEKLVERRKELAAQTERERNEPQISAFKGNSSTFNPHREDYAKAQGRGVNNPNNTAKYIPIPGAGIAANRLVGGGLPPGLNNVPGALNQHLAYPGSNYQYLADRQTADAYNRWQNSAEAKRIDTNAAAARKDRDNTYQNRVNAFNNQNPYNPTIAYPAYR